jgi:transposase
MGMGKRKAERQQDLFVAADKLQSAGHPFYLKLNRLLAEAGFDAFVEAACKPYYAGDAEAGRRSVPPGVYFRMLFVGYFEGIDSQRGLDWRCSDSLALREFLGVPLGEKTPDHSTLSQTRSRLPQEVHDQVFEFVLKLASDKRLLDPKTIGVDSTTLEANAAMKSIVRRETGEGYKEYVKKLAEEAGEDVPDDAALRRFDKKRKNKKCSNEEWVSKSDPEAEITQLKDGRTHLAYKAEHVVDLESEFVLAARVLPGASGDAETLADTVMTAQGHLGRAATLSAEPRTEKQAEDAALAGPILKEVAADSGYHKDATLELLKGLGVRTYIVERDQRRVWRDKPEAHKRATLANRRRVKRRKGRRLQRRRSEVVERTFAHLCETGGARRTWLRGLENVQKRYLMHAAARNLSLVMRKLFKMGTPRSLQGAGEDALARLYALLNALTLLAALHSALETLRAAKPRRPKRSASRRPAPSTARRNRQSQTGC